MPKSIPPGLKPEHVLRALEELDGGAESLFGPPTGYELVREGRRYAPKAVVGLAFRHLSGKPLAPGDFSGGERPGQANHVLRQLGFTVVRKGEAVEGEEALPTRDWKTDETVLVVADYLALLRAELLRLPCDRAERLEALRSRLAGCPDGAVEALHSNISAVLVGMGLPYVPDYEPWDGLTPLLGQAVDAYLADNPTYLDELTEAPLLAPEKAPSTPFDDLTGYFDSPPGRIALPTPGKPWLTRRARRVDFAERDAGNRRLGALGEEFVVELERHRLRSEGRDDLARMVDRVSQSIGDGLGFDLLSFDEHDGSERLIEVKTTGLGKHFPFHVTANEVRCSEDVGQCYFLYRVFGFSSSPRVFFLQGPLSRSCRLEPASYVAGF
jgi:hypothetical protein